VERITVFEIAFQIGHKKVQVRDVVIPVASFPGSSHVNGAIAADDGMFHEDFLFVVSSAPWSLVREFLRLPAPRR